MPDTPLLEIKRLEVFYGDFQALYGLDLRVMPGQIVAIIGANGAGKSTLLNAVAGLNKARRDAIIFDGEPIGGRAPYAVVGKGIALVPEGRKLFPSLSVEENLKIGGQMQRPGEWTLEKVYKLFPVLAERRASPSTELSGGQQQMVAIGRALMSNPKLLLCDELSLGLAPIVVREIYANLRTIVSGGMACVIVEQDIGQALKFASYVYCMLEGRIVLEGAAGSLNRQTIAAAYFGV